MGLKLCKLVVGYDNRAILPPLDINFPNTGVVALLGKNGVGKSTLLNTILGTLDPIDGRVFIDRVEIANGLPHADLVGFCPSELHLSFGMKVEDLISLSQSNLSAKIWEKKPCSSRQWPRLVEILKEFDLYDKRFENFYDLSTGYRKLVGLAACFSRNLPVYLLDEPFSNLDLNHQDIVRKAILKKSQNSLVVVSTHCFPEMLDFSPQSLMIGRSYLFAKTLEVIHSDLFKAEMRVSPNVFEFENKKFVVFT